MSAFAVAVVITCHDLGRTLEEALGSVLGQTRPAAEVLVIDDGSRDPFTRNALAALGERGVRVVRTPGLGVAAARNLGAELTSAPWLVFLDADDALAPTYLAETLAAAEADPELDFVSTGMRAFGLTENTWVPPEPDLAGSLVRGVVHVSTLLRRSAFLAAGGFDSELSNFEDLDLWTGVVKSGARGRVLPELLLSYRVRADSRRRAAIRGPDFAALMQPLYRKHWDALEPLALELLVHQDDVISEQDTHQHHLRLREAELEAELARVEAEIAAHERQLVAQGQERFRWGDLARPQPLSPLWGVERGQPVDRFYIERFLARHAADVAGRVLEVKDPAYTRAYGGEAVTESAVLDIDPHNPRATLIADLTAPGSLPEESFDCVVLTQTLNFLFEVDVALDNLLAALRPGGVLLCTVSALGRIDAEGRRADGDYWRFAEASLLRLFSERFPPGSFEVRPEGNLYSCTAFLQGLATEEIEAERLLPSDPDHPLVYTIRATRARAPIALPEIVSRRDDAVATDARVLMYHRVFQQDPDPHHLCVSPATFRAHLDYLSRERVVLPLVELAQRAAEGTLPARALALTFDDGYRDGLIAAELLAEERLPATHFVTSGRFGEDVPEFWWDQITRILLSELEVPRALEVPALGLSGLATGTPEERRVAHDALAGGLMRAPEEARQAGLAEFVAWSGHALSPRASHATLSASEVQALDRLWGQRVGAHTDSHLLLTAQSPAVRRREVRGPRARLEPLLERALSEFSYPYGGQDPATVREVREAGYAVAVTAVPAPILPGTPALLIPRHEVREQSADALAALLE